MAPAVPPAPVAHASPSPLPEPSEAEQETDAQDSDDESPEIEEAEAEIEAIEEELEAQMEELEAVFEDMEEIFEEEFEAVLEGVMEGFEEEIEELMEGFEEEIERLAEEHEERIEAAAEELETTQDEARRKELEAEIRASSRELGELGAIIGEAFAQAQLGTHLSSIAVPFARIAAETAAQHAEIAKEIGYQERLQEAAPPPHQRCHQAARVFKMNRVRCNPKPAMLEVWWKYVRPNRLYTRCAPQRTATCRR